ncbi:NMDA receptor synaptonuclear signaling and neuronal migration factor [Pimephales promelas]|nr:NMDA receptor synaptonuclear signaling and neuronal migration factor [Pimephales promelas]
MGTAVSKRKNLRNDAISSVAAKVRAARAFGEYLHTHPEDCNGSDSLCAQNNNFHSCTLQGSSISDDPSLINSLLEPPPPTTSSKSRLSLERSFSAEEDQQKCVECSLQPARVYTITGESGMLGTSRGSKENLELEVLKEGREACHGQVLAQPSTSSNSSSPTQRHHHHGSGSGSGSGSGNHHHGNHHHGNHQHGGNGGTSGSSPHQHISGAGTSHHQQGASHHHHHLSQPLQSSVSAHNIRGWGEGKDCGLACESCPGAPSRSQGSLDLESSTREADDNSWFPKENMFSFQTASTTMQAISNFRKHLRMVGSRRMKAQSGDLQTTCCTPDEGGCEDMDWEEEREMERLACEGDDFIPPKIMLISSKVPKAEYVPNIIRKEDPSIIPILYDHEHATFDDILEEIEKRLTAYRKGSKIWRMMIFCQGGPGHLYLLKNKVATFAKVEKEEDMSQFWKRLSRFMSKVNPEPNLIHIMGCYVLGNPNGEKLFQKLKNLMRPYSVKFESPLELSAQGKEMIEMYFDFRLFRLWKTRQHSKLLDYEDLL